MCKLVHLLFWHWLINTALATSAELSITGSPQLNTWEVNGHKKVYNYYFTEEESVILKCAFKRTAPEPARFKLYFYMDGLRQVRQTQMESKFNTDETHLFRIEKRSKVITCVAQRVSGWPMDGEEYYVGELKLHYQPPAPEQPRDIPTQRPEPIKDPCVPNPCGSNSICNNNKGKVACSCLPDFLGSPPNCRPECTTNSECDTTKSCSRKKCINPCTNACGENADCRVVNQQPICSCRQGFEADPFSGCTVVDSTTPPLTDLETSASPAEPSNHYQTITSTEFDLNITGPPKLIFWKQNNAFTKKIYYYSYTGDEKAEFNCTCGNLDPNRLIQTVFTLDTIFAAGCHDKQCTGTLSHKFDLHKGNHNITCEANGWINDTHKIIMRSVVLLHYIDVNISETTAASSEVGPVNTDHQVPVHKDTEPRVSVTLLAITVVTVAIIIAALIALLLKYRAIVRKLESNRIPEHIRSRPALTLPSDIVYDHVYSHGAGLLRPALKPVQ